MKKYIAYWGEGYTEEVQVLALDDLLNTFTDHLIKEHVTDLKVGELFDLSDLSGTVYIVRVI